MHLTQLQLMSVARVDRTELTICRARVLCAVAVLLNSFRCSLIGICWSDFHRCTSFLWDALLAIEFIWIKSVGDRDMHIKHSRFPRAIAHVAQYGHLSRDLDRLANHNYRNRSVSLFPLRNRHPTKLICQVKGIPSMNSNL